MGKENLIQVATRTQIMSLFHIACPEWKSKIEHLCKENWMKANIPVPNKMIEAAYRCANAIQIKAIEDVFDMEFLKSKAVEKWEDLGTIKGYYIETSSSIDTADGVSEPGNQNVFATKKQALSALAMSQLSQLMKQVNGDWVPDWNDNSVKFVIVREASRICNRGARNRYRFLVFNTKETRDQFLINHEQLIKQYYEL